MILPRQNDIFFEGDETRKVLICNKWLAPRRKPFPQNDHAYYHQPGPQAPAYGMQSFAEPPPVYSGDMPPTYQPPPNGPGVYPPPAGGTKVSPQQHGMV
ncbi:hypothetical protein FKW77_008567 [Venturia effusa]|uniref:Uncharacterized protein n=1 Tax=Venturia effusa TaxID=50376 RepID=A0A517KX13_9PEZI|nr:hypothetical protein FKW77_008567 [Venturia effusa]